MIEFGARDRLVMAGLVILGLLTVVAGILSGRSLDYVLARDAREAALSWAGKVNHGLGELGPHAPQFLDQKLDVLNADGFASQAGKQATLPIGSASQHGFALVDYFGRLTTSWAANHSSSPGQFVSKLEGFALLGPDSKPLAVGGDLPAGTLERMLAQDGSKDALAAAIQNDTVVTAPVSGAGDNRLAFVPATENGKVSRVYAFALDQSAAAGLANLALTVVTLTTSLLIVMGFSVPAAIASRRIRERWLAEDQIRFLAMHDSLTGLPNRLQLRQHLDRAVARSKRHGNLMAVLCLDLDRFKDVNDTLGHATGERCLPRSQPGCGRACVKPIWSDGWAATSSPSSPRTSRRRRMPCGSRGVSAPRSASPTMSMTTK
jgi:hypothetical protein